MPARGTDAVDPDPDHLVLDIADAGLLPVQDHVHGLLHDPTRPISPTQLTTFQSNLPQVQSSVTTSPHRRHPTRTPTILQLPVNLLRPQSTPNQASPGGSDNPRNPQPGIIPTTPMRTGVTGDPPMPPRKLPMPRLLHLIKLTTMMIKMNFHFLISRCPKQKNGPRRSNGL